LSHRYSPERDVYAIPKHDEGHLTNRREYAIKLIKDLSTPSKVENKAIQIDGCDLIRFNNNFVFLLDQAYKSFLVGMNYSSVSLCGMAIERLCYDFMLLSDISFEGKQLEESQISYLNNMPLKKLIDFLCAIGYIDRSVRKIMLDINDKRNNYIHPNLDKINPEEDARTCLNNLCKLVDIISKKTTHQNTTN
jgi:hypothetical protein